MLDRFIDYVAQRPELEILIVGAAAVVVAVVIAFVMDIFVGRAEREELKDVAAYTPRVSASEGGPDSLLASRPLLDGVPVWARERGGVDDRHARLRATVDSRQN
jgi:hypothetical protein